MNRRQLLCAFASTAFVPMFGARAVHAEVRRISGPFTHANLSVYFVHGASEAGPVPLTLAEALKAGKVEVIETQDVNELKVRNKGLLPVFIQSGDIVKGGQQDRVLTVSLLLPPKSGLLPIASFCVEQGRWEARENENVKQFSASEKTLPSKEMKLALKARQIDPAATGSAEPADTGSRQQKVWAEVKKTQDKLSGALETAVAAPKSESSLQLALENAGLELAKSGFAKAFEANPPPEDAIGFVFAINGTINSADLYVSNGLFKKLWPKLLDAASTEAIAEKASKSAAPPAIEAIEAFLAAAEKGETETRDLVAKVVLENRENAKSVYSETRVKGGPVLHRNYLSK
jgi:hypothetical protein